MVHSRRAAVHSRRLHPDIAAIDQSIAIRATLYPIIFAICRAIFFVIRTIFFKARPDYRRHTGNIGGFHIRRSDYASVARRHQLECCRTFRCSRFHRNGKEFCGHVVQSRRRNRRRIKVSGNPFQIRGIRYIIPTRRHCRSKHIYIDFLSLR